ncbi:MAG: hypothetical protein VKJ04_11690 [Vampirovibrionales bacterium]|nr:hypothetical protein [Vampirovibrionales bacterium]
MGPRNLMILFISTVALSLVLLILVFSLFFKNVDLSFDTKMPDSAPDLSNFYKDDKTPSETRGDNVNRSNVNVPANSAPQAASNRPASGVGDEDLNQSEEAPDNDAEPQDQQEKDVPGASQLQDGVYTDNPSLMKPESRSSPESVKPKSSTAAPLPGGNNASSAPVPPVPSARPVQKAPAKRIEPESSGMAPPANPEPASSSGN